MDGFDIALAVVRWIGKHPWVLVVLALLGWLMGEL